MPSTNLIEAINSELFALSDKDYAEFHSKLIPNIPSEKVIGVRTPALRAYAKSICGTEKAKEFLQILPHTYYEENNLHAFLIEQIKNYDVLISELDRFLPFIDNWATCDMLRPKAFSRHKTELLEKIRIWLKSDRTYTVRFGIEMLMVHFLIEDFSPEYPKLVAGVQSSEYYINMMRAWYFATALAKQYEAVVPYIEEKRLDPWTHNKAIQKSLESYRITKEQKEYLKTLKVK